MQNFILKKMMKSIDDLAQYLNGLFFSEIFAFFDVSIKITVIAVLKDEVVVVGSFLHIVKLYNIVALTTL
jgi:hypothetical protein